MDDERQLSSVELERLLLNRRRQEAVERLRSLPAVPSAPAASAEVLTLAPSGLRRPDGSPALARMAAATLSCPVPASSSAPLSPIEAWLQRRQVRLRPVQSQKRARRRPTHPLLMALKKGLSRFVDVLIVLVLILFVFALGFWIYDNYVDPLLSHAGGSIVPGDASWMPSQGWLSSPGEAAPSAPLPFVPYSSTVTMEAPYVPIPTPAPGTLMPDRLVIPAIQLDARVEEVSIENGAWQVAQYAAGYHRGTARPGTVGNTVISGHKGMFGAVFYRLDDLKMGDEIFVYAGPRLYRYTVAEKKNVWPYQVEVMAQTPDPILTLITCTAFDTQRLVVVARYDREMPTGASAGP
jgi:sortase A